MKISKEDVDRIKQEHEDIVVEEVRQAAPHVHEKEIRRLVKEHGDGNKVLELLTGQPSNELQHQEQSPNEEMIESPNGEKVGAESPEADILATSMEILSLEQPTPVENGEPEVASETPPSMAEPNEFENAKNKARQRRHASAARKEKQSKRAQKEAAKRRKRKEAMGIEQVKESSEQEHVLKAIVI